MSGSQGCKSIGNTVYRKGLENNKRDTKLAFVYIINLMNVILAVLKFNHVSENFLLMIFWLNAHQYSI